MIQWIFGWPLRQIVIFTNFDTICQALKFQDNLYGWLKGNISTCPKQLFIFDEVDKMPPGVLNAIKPIIDYRDVVDGVDYTKSIFIFLSNTGARLINKQYQDYWTAGRRREDLQLNDFENLIMQGAFNEKGMYIYEHLLILICIRKFH